MRFRGTPNQIWHPETINPGTLLTDAQVTPGGYTSNEHHDEVEIYESENAEFYERAATNKLIRGKQDANRAEPDKRKTNAELIGQGLRQGQKSRTSNRIKRWQG